MALSPQLLNFKSSGVYRLEFDKSQTSNIDVETLRLVVGSSRKGPYNTPVLIDSQESFNDVFGSIDRGLEKKGMFFHRSCLEALSRGPILALNLGAFTDADTANGVSLSTTGSVESIFAVPSTKEYDSFFDNDKFMTPSDTEVLKSLANDEDHLLNFVNIKQESITIIVRQAQDVTEFNSTAREWYGIGNVPEYLNEFDRISDFMVDVFVFKGEFDADLMSADPIYSEFFTAEGLKKSRLNEFANLRQVNLIAQYTGSIIPGFKDLEGRNLYIESIVNSEARRTGLFCAVDEDKVLDEDGTKVDFVGHMVDADEDFELLSHKSKQTVNPEHTLVTVGNNTVDNTITTASTLLIEDVAETVRDAAFATLSDGSTEFLLANTVDPEYAEVTAVSSWTQTAGNNAGFNDPAALDFTFTDTVNARQVIISQPGGVWNLTITGPQITTISQGDYFFGGSGQPNVEITNAIFAPGGTGANTYVLSGQPDSSLTQALSVPPGTISIDVFDGDGVIAAVPFIGNFTITCNEPIDTSLETATDIVLHHVSNSRVIPFEFGVTGGDTGVYTAGAANSTDFSVEYPTAPTSFPITIGDYVQSATQGRLARVERIGKTVAAAPSTTVAYVVYTDIPPAYDNQIIKSFENASDRYKTFVLPKASIEVKNITQYLSVLTGGTGLFDALIDKDIIDFRYVVDTFTSFDSNGINTKSNLSKLAKDRQNASAILNAPTIADFRQPLDPSFVDDDGIFDSYYVTTGGNQDKNPTKLYTLPSINEGANYAFYYGPGLIVSDNGKDIIVPPAAYVSNNYIDKYTSALPWSIIAGPRRGVVSGTNVRGVEYAFDKNDRDNLEPFGINPIVFQRGVGLTILGNKTGQQAIKSALSSAHVREAMIYIQDGIANILKDYVFEFNTTQTRLEIKTLADSFMESVLADGGVYAYRNVMDSTNNTNDVIDNNIGIIDTFVEPVKGLEIVVHRTTILNTGEIESGNLG